MLNRKLSIVPPVQSDESMTRAGGNFKRMAPVGEPPQDLFWTCATCGVIEPYFVAVHPGKWIKRTCPCERKRREELREQGARNTWIMKYRTRTYGGWLGEKWADPDVVREMSAKTFDNYRRGRFPEAFAAALKFARHPSGNLVFCGGFGTGKTHLESAIANFLREQTPPRKQGDYGVPSLFVTAPQFFMVYDQTKKSFDQGPHIALIQQAIETPLLILDDIDKCKPKEEREEVYYHLIDERYKAKRPTVLSTNKMELLNTYIGDAAMDRLMRGIIPVEMVGDSYRLEEE